MDYSFWFQLYFALVSAYLSYILAKVFKQNGRVLKKIDETTKMLGEKIDGTARIVGEKIDEGFRKMDRGLELIAKLIVEENEKTRKEILSALGK